MSFFFQAEDGIRDGRVTGVQTCALPISAAGHVHMAGAAAAGNLLASREVPAAMLAAFAGAADEDLGDRLVAALRAGRLEERRVGKECRCGRARYYSD